MMHGHGQVRSLTVLPLTVDGSVEWSHSLKPHFPLLTLEYLWEFPLGQRLRDIRLKGYYLRGKQAPVRKRQLDALGFVWKPQRGRRRKQ